MKAVFDEQCRERLRAKLPQQFIASRVLKIAGLGESACDARVAPIYTRHAEVETTILAGAGEIQLHLRSRANSMASAEERVEALVEQIENELGDNVISDNGDSMEQILGYYLQMRNATLAVAESCTGGLLAERITSVAGSSRYFLGGSVAYANSLKTALAGVPADLIDRHTAVSPQVALALAAGIRERCGSSWGIGITGIAGPGGGTIEKPVGLVFLALAGRDGSEAVERRFSGDRNRIRLYAAQQAMDMLRRKLM
jgi:nicotinamide-nucleotide amidase